MYGSFAMLSGFDNRECRANMSKTLCQRHAECATGLFAEFLVTAGFYESWADSCPLSYSSGIESHKQYVLVPGLCRFRPATIAMRISPNCPATWEDHRSLGGGSL